VGAGNDFDLLGGEAALRAIIEDFTARVFSDVMIGFLFAGKNHARITEMEYQFAAQHLGGGVAYSGRTIRNAHRSSPIMGGHFMRRRQILANTLAAHGVDPAIVKRWLDHVDSLRDQVLGAGDAGGSECDHDDQMRRLGRESGSVDAKTDAKKGLTRLPVFGD